MSNIIKVNEPSLSASKENIVFFNPDYVYIPMFPGFTLKVKDNNIVKREQVLLSDGSINIYSPVSGKVLGKTVDMGLNGEIVSSVVIENDFKENIAKRKGVVRNINGYTKEEASSLLKLYNATKIDLDMDVQSLVVSGFDLDPFEYTESYIINHHSDKILETVDALVDILKIDSALLIVNKNDSLNVINLNNNIGSYPNIKLKLIENVYPIANKTLLLNKVLSKKELNDKVLFLTVEDVLNIYNVLKRKQPIINKYVTIAGDCLDKKMVLCTKIGVSFKDLINNISGINKKEYDVVINGLIAGHTVNNLNEIVNSDTRSIFITPHLKDHPSSCINCGLCNMECPVGLNPKYIMEHKKANRSACINCGLCTYICPSKINFKNILGGEKHE